MIIEFLDFGVCRLVSFVGCLGFGFVGKDPLDLGMRVFSGRFGQFHHVGFDPGGGDVEILKIEEDFQRGVNVWGKDSGTFRQQSVYGLNRKISRKQVK